MTKLRGAFREYEKVPKMAMKIPFSFLFKVIKTKSYFLSYFHSF
jgi:hypothetical protein